MFSKIKEFIKNNSFEIILGFSIAIIIIIGLYNKITRKKGSWSKYYIYNEDKGRKYNEKYNNYNNYTNIPEKKDSKGEVECRNVLEKIFDKPFTKTRPDFLKNEITGGYNLEIDCYNDELKIGVEYNGVQHYKYIPYFHKNKEAFYNQKYRDELKRRMCKDNGIYLIEVPYTVKIENIESYISKELRNYISKYE